MNNLYAACISCNRAKGARTTRSMRLRRGLTRAPMSANARTAAKRWNAIGGSLLGGIPSVILLGPPGAVLGAALGAVLGHERDPDNG
jgi:hypothetical protein